MKTPQKYLDRMDEAKGDNRIDPERSHGNADKILCEFLRELGYEDLIDVYESFENMWCA